MLLNDYLKRVFIFATLFIYASEASEHALIMRVAEAAEALKSAGSLCPSLVPHRFFILDWEGKIQFKKYNGQAAKQASLLDPALTACHAENLCKFGKLLPVKNSEDASKVWGSALRHCDPSNLPATNNYINGDGGAMNVFTGEASDMSKEEYFQNESANSLESAKLSNSLTIGSMVCFFFGFLIGGALLSLFRFANHSTSNVDVKVKSLRRPEL